MQQVVVSTLLRIVRASRWAASIREILPEEQPLALAAPPPACLFAERDELRVLFQDVIRAAERFVNGSGRATSKVDASEEEETFTFTAPAPVHLPCANEHQPVKAAPQVGVCATRWTPALGRIAAEVQAFTFTAPGPSILKPPDLYRHPHLHGATNFVAFDHRSPGFEAF